MALIDKLNAIGDAIREKNGTTEPIPLVDMPQAIKEISGDGSASLNIAYGEEPPEDTSKLWIKANEPENVIFSRSVEGSNEISEIGNMPDNAYYVGCVPIGEKVYIMGGTDDINNVKYIKFYDTQTGVVTETKTTTIGSNGGYGSACGAVGTTIYTFSGYMNNYGSNKYARYCFAYDTLTDTRTGGEDTSVGYRLYMGYCTIGKNIYSFGGSHSNTRYNDVRIYDTEAGTISTLSTKLPFSWGKMGCVAIGENIYLLGGYNYTNQNYINLIYRFNILTQSFDNVAVSLPVACSNMGCAAVGSKIYIFGGENADGVLDTILEFDTETETIKTLGNAMPFGCARMGCVAVDENIYLFGGYDGTTAVNTIQKFTLTQQLNQRDILVKTSVKNLFNIINTDNSQVEVGVEGVYVGNENNEAELCEAYLHNGIGWQQI